MLAWVCWLWGWLQTLVFTAFLAAVLKEWSVDGLEGVLRLLLHLIRAVPGVDHILHRILSGEVKKFTAKQSQRPSAGGNKPPKVIIPEKGVPKDELLAKITELKESQINPEDGKIFAYVYTAEGDTFEAQRKAYDMFTESTGLSAEHDQLVREFHHAFMHENALNPMIFPALRRFENEIVSMTASMLNGDEEVVGSLTSGGTESILMAMKSYRDRARKLWPHITKPEMVAPITIHPAHEKAAYYFGFKIVHIPVGDDFRPHPADYEQAITRNTIALLTSATQYCHGMVDPIAEVSQIALRHDLPLHVDACFGGFMLPWVEKLGYPVPVFDFRVPGVTSITADIHKYGFGAKGASVVLYRDETLRKFQIFAYSKWPGGLFGSPSMAGTRPGGNIAAAWVALQAMGQDGYLRVAKQLMDTTKKLKEGINKIPGLCILGNPVMTSFAIGSDNPDVNILAVADVLEESGWKPERQQMPDSLHCSILPHHIGREDALLQALADAAQRVKGNKDLVKAGSAAMYGMVSNIPDKSIVDDFIVEFFSEVYKA